MLGFNREINGLKADTLSDLGRRVEIAYLLTGEEERFSKRLYKMIERIKNTPEKSLKRKKRKQYKNILPKLEEKLSKSENRLKKLYAARDLALKNYKAQREILGLYDHTFIDSFIEKLKEAENS